MLQWAELLGDSKHVIWLCQSFLEKKPPTEAVRRMQSYNEHILKMPIMNVSTCNIVNIVDKSRIHSTKLFSLFFSCQVFLSSPYAKIYLPQFFSKRLLA